MNKWEYMHIEVYKNEVRYVDGKDVGEYKFGLPAPKLEGPDITETLNNLGQQGWEIAGIAPASTMAMSWRLILKRCPQD